MKRPTIKIKTTPWGFQVCGTVKGQMRRQQFSGDDAEQRALTTKQSWELEIANMPAKPMTFTRMTDVQCKEAETCFALIENSPLSLRAIVEFGLRSWRPAVNDSTLSKAIDLFVNERTRENLRERTVMNLEVRLAAFLKWQKDGKVSDVLADHISGWLFRTTDKVRSARTILNDRLVLSNFFNWCVEKKFCAASPVDAVRAPKVRGRRAPASLAIGDVRKLLAAAVNYRDGLAVPYFVMALFGGMRPKEVARLSWDLVDLKRGRVDVNHDVAKTGEHRWVTLTPNMVEWLTPYALKRTPFDIPRFQFDVVRKLAKVPWAADVMRHTAVSNFLADGATDRAATERHGHSVTVMLKHYRDRVTPEDAKAFWQIVPGGLGADVVQLAKAA